MFSDCSYLPATALRVWVVVWGGPFSEPIRETQQWRLWHFLKLCDTSVLWPRGGKRAFMSKNSRETDRQSVWRKWRVARLPCISHDGWGGRDITTDQWRVKQPELLVAATNTAGRYRGAAWNRQSGPSGRWRNTVTQREAEENRDVQKPSGWSSKQRVTHLSPVKTQLLLRTIRENIQTLKRPDRRRRVPAPNRHTWVTTTQTVASATQTESCVCWQQQTDKLEAKRKWRRVAV